jgi:hypothetical protein
MQCDPSSSNSYPPIYFPAIVASSVSHQETRELMIPLGNVPYSRGKAHSEKVSPFWKTSPALVFDINNLLYFLAMPVHFYYFNRGGL